IEDNKIVDSLNTENNKYVSYITKPVLSIPKDEFTTVLKTPQRDKILLIHSVENFDHFTNKYGDINFNQTYIFINWDRVAKDYKGFYLDQDSRELYLRRHSMAVYKRYRF